MVFGVLITDVEELHIYFSNFYGNIANDTKKNLRMKYLLNKLQENCTQHKEMHKEKILLLNSLKQKDIINPKYKQESNDEGKQNYEKDIFEGCILISEPKLFEQEMIVLWKKKGSSSNCLSFILFTDENVNLAINILDKIFEEVILKNQFNENWASISKILDTILPEGQVAFFSPSNINSFLK